VIRTVKATRYVTPLREGGSLPAIVEGDDLGTYVLKFRGAGQGPKVLIAELLAGELGRAMGLPVPELVLVDLDPAIGRSEPDPEIQYLIQASAGVNLALDYLPGSFAFDPAITPPPDEELASEIVWFDAYIINVDRTARNTNMLIWHRKLWLIDHGSAFYVHHGDAPLVPRAADPFPAIKDHVLLQLASDIPGAGRRLASRLSSAEIMEVVALIPDTWLDPTVSPETRRAEYAEYLTKRLEAFDTFTEAAIDARTSLV
jgi:hypothetical protein